MEENKKKSHEIDIVGIAKRVLAEWKLLLKFVGVAAVLGVVIALNTPKSYTTSVILAPEVSGAGGMLDNLSDLASMVGVNIGSSSSSIDAIYPEIYPDVISSNRFIIDLFDVKVRLKDNTERTFYDHVTKDVKIPFWSWPQIWISTLFKEEEKANQKDVDPFCLTKEQSGVCALFRSRVSCIVDKKTSVVTISFEDNDPVASAVMADTILSRLQQYITHYRTKKARIDVDYYEQLFNAAKKEYEDARHKYARAADASTRVVLVSRQSELDDLENDMQLKYSVYQQMTQQLNIAHAKLQERTPAFSVIQEATVPIRASSFPRSLMVIGYMLLGAILCAIWIMYLRDPIKKLLSKRKK
ncbi:MAG: chain-length determining protein [Prevotella sp.]|nr:chain-length determining protein [Prevotella sp.]